MSLAGETTFLSPSSPHPKFLRVRVLNFLPHRRNSVVRWSKDGSRSCADGRFTFPSAPTATRSFFDGGARQNRSGDRVCYSEEGMKGLACEWPTRGKFGDFYWQKTKLPSPLLHIAGCPWGRNRRLSFIFFFNFLLKFRSELLMPRLSRMRLLVALPTSF